MIAIAVIGSRNSGKTTAIEALVKGLTRKGYNVATIKHVSEPSFTLDSEGKDTWRHAQAGAKMIVVVAPKELAIIRKTDTAKLSLQEIIKNCKDNVDIIILEGFRNLVKQEPKVLKIAVVKTSEETKEMSKIFKPIIAFTGSTALNARRLSIPIVDVLTEPEKLVEIVLSYM